jgi:hypothetical protein
MIAILHLTTLVAATMLAAASATAMNWLALRLAFQLMRPAGVRPSAVRSELLRDTSELVHALAPRR